MNNSNLIVIFAKIVNAMFIAENWSELELLAYLIE